MGGAVARFAPERIPGVVGGGGVGKWVGYKALPGHPVELLRVTLQGGCRGEIRTRTNTGGGVCGGGG